MYKNTAEGQERSGLFILFCCSFFFLALSATCGAPQIQLHDNKMEEVVEKTISKTISVNDENYKKAMEKHAQSIDDLYILAMDRSEKIAIGAEDVFQARESARQAWGSVLPQLSLRANLNLPVNFFTGSLFGAGFRFYVRQNIMSGLNEYSGIQAAPLLEKFNAFQLKASAASLYDQIAQVYFEYLLVQDSLNTQKILLESSSGIKNELEKRFYLGKIRRSEILNVEVVIAQTEAQITNSHILLHEAQKS